MAYPIEIKEKAVSLRKRGYSIKEVAKILSISKSTSSGWLSNISLNPTAIRRLQERRIYGQEKARQIAFRKRDARETTRIDKARKVVAKIPKNMDIYTLIAAILFWTEGSKDQGVSLRFTNSDPKMVKLFITALKESCDFHWHKLKAKLHLHNYHDPAKQTELWSGITGIPKVNFLRPYLKPHTAIRKRNNYPGCIMIYYYDTELNRLLTAIYRAIVEKYSS